MCNAQNLFGFFKLALILSTWQIGNPICIPSQMNIDIGRIASIENNLKPVYRAEKGQQVVIKVCAWIKIGFYILNFFDSQINGIFITMIVMLRKKEKKWLMSVIISYL